MSEEQGNEQHRIIITHDEDDNNESNRLVM